MNSFRSIRIAKIIFLPALLLLVACIPSIDPTQAEQTHVAQFHAGETVPAAVWTQTPDLEINMQRSPGMEKGPVYMITILGDGTVTYTGWTYVEIMEVRETKITPNEVKDLVKEFEAISFFEIETPEIRVALDCPVTIVSFTHEGQCKSYIDYIACSFEPAPYDKKILQIAQKIDEVTNSKQWLGDTAYELLQRSYP